MKIMQSMFPNYKEMALGINNRKKFAKFTNMQKPKILLNNQWAEKKLGNTLR